MVKAVYDHHEPALEVDRAPDVEADTPLSDGALSDGALLELLDALVVTRGRVPASRALGVNYRTLANCCDTRQVSRRMRQALVAFRDAGGVVSAQPDGVDGGNDTEERGDMLASRVEELESENAELRDLLAERDRELELLTGRLAMLEEAGQLTDDGVVVVVENGHDDVGAREWRPPRRGSRMPEAGVVTLEEQRDEEHAFGPAAELVALWRQLVNSGGRSLSRVDRAQAAVRRWELEAEMLGEFHLTLPPDTHPLDHARRADQVRWRREALVEARRELGRAKRTRLLRRMLTLGLSRE